MLFYSVWGILSTPNGVFCIMVLGDKYGNKIVVFDRYSQVPDGLTLVEDVNNPFDITDTSGNLKF